MCQAVGIEAGSTMGLARLQAWLADGSQGSSPQNTDRLLTLYDVSKAIEFLHVRSLMHRNLQPASFLWFPQQVRPRQALRCPHSCCCGLAVAGHHPTSHAPIKQAPSC